MVVELQLGDRAAIKDTEVNWVLGRKRNRNFTKDTRLCVYSEQNKNKNVFCCLFFNFNDYLISINYVYLLSYFISLISQDCFTVS